MHNFSCYSCPTANVFFSAATMAAFSGVTSTPTCVVSETAWSLKKPLVVSVMCLSFLAPCSVFSSAFTCNREGRVEKG